MTLSFVGAEEVNFYRVTMALHAIAMEINTGMKPTRGFSAKRFAEQYGYTGSSNKKAVLRWLVKETGFEPEPGTSIAKALA